MIKNYEQYNESIKSLLVRKTKEELWNNLIKYKLSDFIDSIPKSPEDFFLKMKNECEIIRVDDYYIYWGKNNTELFWEGLKSGYLHINLDYIWSPLKQIYGLNYNEIQSLIKNLLYDTNWRGLIPTYRRGMFSNH